MNTTERVGAPAVGNALGYFVALWFINKVTWLDAGDEALAVAAAGTICIHVLAEARNILAWIIERISNVSTGED